MQNAVQKATGATENSGASRGPHPARVRAGFPERHPMARIDGILKLVKDQGASDLHMTTGSPPIVRINGEITPIPYEELTREMSELLLFEMMDPAVRAKYEEFPFAPRNAARGNLAARQDGALHASPPAGNLPLYPEFGNATMAVPRLPSRPAVVKEAQ